MTLSLLSAYSAGLDPRIDWRQDSACNDEDPEIFFPIGEGAAARQATKRALAVCNKICPVRDECLEFAITHGEVWGIWGGTTENERREMIRARLDRPQKSVAAAAAAAEVKLPAAPKRGNAWTEEEILKLHELFALNYNDDAIGTKLGRSIDAVSRRRLKSELYRKAPQDRQN